jgi:putative oxidoreductase
VLLQRREHRTTMEAADGQGEQLPPMTALLYVQGVTEIIGGILLLIGAYTRVVSFILAGDMAVAYFIAHFPRSFFPAVNGGDAAVLFCFAFCYIVFAGGDPWSVDRAVLKQA